MAQMIELLSLLDGGFQSFVPSLIVLNTEDFGCAPILVKTVGRLFDVDNCNISNTEVLVLDGSSSPSFPFITSLKMC